jgi:DNA-directed RNA polymerase sigma subunit (sigma70/sigma32)
LGRDYGISRERVRQIENRAFEKLQMAMMQEVKKGQLQSSVSRPTP